MRAHIMDLQPGDKLAQDVFNNFGLNVLSQGTVLNDREISRLLQHQIDYVDIEERIEPGLPDSSQNSNHHGADKLLPVFEDALQGISELFVNAMAEGKVQSEDVDRTFTPLVEGCRTEKDVVSLLVALNDKDDYTCQHSVQVGMISYYIAGWMGYSEEEAQQVGKAGFLHDIGKCRIDYQILNKPGKLTEEEFETVKQHTLHGEEILRESLEDEMYALVALQHHERFDGSGYPHGLKGEEIIPAARIVAIADIYSAMISSRVYQEKQDLLHVLNELYELSFHKLDPIITQTFIKNMIPNFIGKKVELETGETGTIVMTNPSDFFRPLIQVGEEFIDISRKPDKGIKDIQL
ncbi:HD family phosphohydrolase [Paenibacillus sambharensis]|uniref:HD family phosphohydrolase n=1 Tax=Paenibacillus sambharensis TaxID=1803190 RepID=A0A2W1L802_9BACL|nr:HD-GYP domain-containing protein [Paenibacillus sambharensis]PZD94270.1 HD family phosphohydrolase [Paenibacillus sambharensis]